MKYGDTEKETQRQPATEREGERGRIDEPESHGKMTKRRTNFGNNLFISSFRLCCSHVDACWMARTHANNHRQHIQYKPIRFDAQRHRCLFACQFVYQRKFSYSSSAVKPFGWNEPWIMYNDDDSNRPHDTRQPQPDTHSPSPFIRTKGYNRIEWNEASIEQYYCQSHAFRTQT